MRKSQLYGQIFIYILTILIISLILIYGYNAITNFKGRTEQIVSLKLGEDIKSSVERIKPDYGSVVKKEIDVGGASQICFVESFPSILSTNTPVGKDSDDNNIIVNPIVKDSISSGSDKNVFLIKKTVSNSFNVGSIRVSESIVTGHTNVFCVYPKNGIAILKLTGKGDHALVEKWA